MQTKSLFQQVSRPLSPTPIPTRGRQQQRAAGLAALLPLVIALASPGQAGVRFENCQGAADGSISCDTVPTGDTLADDQAARFGLFDNASPGWSEFDPYAGYGDDFGGNQT
jgi:hypothetical protein